MSVFPYSFSPILGGCGLGDYGKGIYGLGASIPLLAGESQVQQADGKVEPADPLERPAYVQWGRALDFDNCGLTRIPLYWEMRRYHAIALAFAITTAPALAGTRSIEVVDDLGDPDFAEEVKKAAEADLLPAFNDALPGAMECMNFGHWLQEVVWDMRDGGLYVAHCKSFRPNEAIVYQDKFGEFAGYMTATNEFRDARYAYLSVNNPHMDRIFGESRNEFCKKEWNRAQQSEKNADRTERKASSRQMFLGLPTGRMYADPVTGQHLMTSDVANKILEASLAGEIITVPRSLFSPRDVKDKPELADIPAVKTDMVDWGNIGPNLEAHLKRLDRLDASMMQAWRRPVREAMQAQHGAKNEGVAQGQIAITDTEQIHADRCKQWDKQVTDRWLVARWPNAKPGMIRTKPAPLSDPQQMFLQQAAVALLANTSPTGQEFVDSIDPRGLADRTEIPLLSVEDAQKKTEERQQAEADAAAEQAKQKTDQLKAMNGNGGKSATNGNSRLKLDGEDDRPHLSHLLSRMLDDGEE